MKEDKKYLEENRKRIVLLEEFHVSLKKWFNADYGTEGQDSLRSYINRNIHAVRNIVIEAGTLKRITIAPPVSIGGMVIKNADPFENIFESFWGFSPIPAAMDSIDQAIGVYTFLETDPSFIKIMKAETIDIETSIERSLRPFFKKQPPNNEKEVQDAIENILNVIGVRFTREKEVTPVGSRSFIPDFVIEDNKLAIEVKLAKAGHTASLIQEEIAADITAYRTRWKHILFVIYDIGEISDPYMMRKENIRLFGISMIIIKH